MAKHELWCWEVDSLDETDDESQLAYVWCETHQKYEWHNLLQREIGRSVTRYTDRNPVM